MEKIGILYILANKKMGTLYIGSTSDIKRRIGQHKEKFFKGSFTEKYGVDKLVYYEWFERLENMVKRERELKHWNRNWKIKLIVQKNPEWHDLYNELLDIGEVI